MNLHHDARRRRLRRVPAATAAVLALAVLAAPGADARGLDATVSVRGAGAASHPIQVLAQTRPGTVCSLRVHAGQTTQRMPRLKADARGLAGWRWVALPISPRGRWSFHVACRRRGRTAARTLHARVRTSARVGLGPLGDSSSLVVRGTILGPHGRTGPVGLGAGGNPFPWHQCTWWAWEKRSDVYALAVRAGVPAGGSRGRDQGTTVYVWDGGRWLPNAQRAGIPTGQRPAVGALVGFGPYPGNPYGHVAYVEAVTSDTWIKVSDCNGFTLTCGSRWINPHGSRGPLEGYVYGGPAGNGPPAPTSPGPAPPAPSPGTPPKPAPPAPRTWSEQQGHHGANTFTNPYNASGMGVKVPAAATVQVSCKVYAPAIVSANPDGYWYRIASAPWSNAYYAVANTFMNGDPWNGPYTHNTDWSVPDC